MNDGSELAQRIALVMAGVLRQAIEDAGARGVVVLGSASPEGKLLVTWAVRGLGADAVWCAPRHDRDAAAALAEGEEDDEAAARSAAEYERMGGRLLAARHRALVAHPANKTTLLLGGDFPPEPLLPLGDLYASQLARLAGDWSAPPGVRALATRAGGIDALDGALQDVLERRLFTPSGADPAIATTIVQALDAGRFARRRAGLVPKLGARTIGVDLFG